MVASAVSLELDPSVESPVSVPLMVSTESDPSVVSLVSAALLVSAESAASVSVDVVASPMAALMVMPPAMAVSVTDVEPVDMAATEDRIATLATDLLL